MRGSGGLGTHTPAAMETERQWSRCDFADGVNQTEERADVTSGLGHRNVRSGQDQNQL